MVQMTSAWCAEGIYRVVWISPHVQGLKNLHNSKMGSRTSVPMSKMLKQRKKEEEWIVVVNHLLPRSQLLSFSHLLSISSYTNSFSFLSLCSNSLCCWSSLSELFYMCFEGMCGKCVWVIAGLICHYSASYTQGQQTASISLAPAHKSWVSFPPDKC